MTVAQGSYVCLQSVPRICNTWPPLLPISFKAKAGRLAYLGKKCSFTQAVWHKVCQMYLCFEELTQAGVT